MPVTSGTTALPHCSTAPTAMRWRREIWAWPKAPSRTERSVATRWIAATPTSVAFSTSQAARSGRGGATSSSTRSRGSSDGAPPASATTPRARSTRAITPRRARPEPSTTRTDSPARSRLARNRC